MTLYTVIISVLALITVGFIIMNTDSPTKALAYMFLVLTFPILGILIYFSFGINYRKHKLYSKKLRIDKKAFPELEEQLNSFTKQTIDNNREKLKHFVGLAQFNRQDNILLPHNQLKLLINGENKYPEVLKCLKAAKHHIHLEYYIFENGPLGSQIGEILKQKAKEGVEVRFVYDDFGSQAIRKDFVKDLKKAGVQAVPFYKIKLIALASTMNYRNHRKLIVVDGQIGFVGGINVRDKTINEEGKSLYWRDTHLKIQGPGVMGLQRVFLSDWNFCAKQDLQVTEDYFPINSVNQKTYGDQLVQIVYSGPDSDHSTIMYAFVQALLLAQKEVFITTPYLVPSRSLINALKIAALSGVDIRILVPGESDSTVVNAVSHSYYLDLMEAGVSIYKYRKGFVHAKTMVCDALISFVGTSNLDQRSFDLNFEVNALVYDPAISQELREQFLVDLQDAEVLDLDRWKNRSFFSILFERVVRLFSPLV